MLGLTRRSRLGQRLSRLRHSEEADELADGAWSEQIIRNALRRLRAGHAADVIEAFEQAYWPEAGSGEPDWRRYAAAWCISEDSVQRKVRRVREAFRESLLAELQEMTASREEFEEEKRWLYGIIGQAL